LDPNLLHNCHIPGIRGWINVIDKSVNLLGGVDEKFEGLHNVTETKKIWVGEFRSRIVPGTKCAGRTTVLLRPVGGLNDKSDLKVRQDGVDGSLGCGDEWGDSVQVTIGNWRVQLWDTQNKKSFMIKQRKKKKSYG
jgi:hypothetical protein